MKILVTGDRKWNDWDVIRNAFTSIEFMFDVSMHDIELIHGNAPGADTMASRIIYTAGGKVKAYPANWSYYRRSAGPIRNTVMLNENSDIKIVLAFHDDIEHSKGTKDMVMKARKANIPVFVYSHYEMSDEKRKA